LTYPTYWGFAKGWIEEGESEEQTAKREISEEAGLNVTFLPGFRQEQKWLFKFNNEWINKYAVFFLAKISKEEAGKVKISDEHEDFAWLEYSEAVKTCRVKANKMMLASALEFIKKYEGQKRLV